jgi:hypothetical protein
MGAASPSDAEPRNATANAAAESSSAPVPFPFMVLPSYRSGQRAERGLFHSWVGACDPFSAFEGTTVGACLQGQDVARNQVFAVESDLKKRRSMRATLTEPAAEG